MNKPDKASEWFKKVDTGYAGALSAVMDTYARVSLANLHLHATSMDRIMRKVPSVLQCMLLVIGHMSCNN